MHHRNLIIMIFIFFVVWPEYSTCNQSFDPVWSKNPVENFNFYFGTPYCISDDGNYYMTYFDGIVNVKEINSDLSVNIFPVYIDYGYGVISYPIFFEFTEEGNLLADYVDLIQIFDIHNGNVIDSFFTPIMRPRAISYKKKLIAIQDYNESEKKLTNGFKIVDLVTQDTIFSDTIFSMFYELYCNNDDNFQFNDFHFSQDGKYLIICAFKSIFIYDVEKKIKIWNYEQYWMDNAFLSNDGKELIISSDSIHVYDFATFKLKRSYKCFETATMFTLSTLSKDNKYMASWDLNKIIITDYQSGEIIRTIYPSDYITPLPDSYLEVGLYSVRFSNDSKSVFILNNHNIFQISILSGKLLNLLASTNDSYNYDADLNSGLANFFNNDSELLVVEKELSIIWDLNNYKGIDVLNLNFVDVDPKLICVNPVDDILYYAKDSILYYWDIKNKNLINQIEFHGKIMGLTISNDGKLLVVSPLISILDSKSGDQILTYPVGYSRMNFSKDDKYLLCYGYTSQLIIDLRNNKLIKKMDIKSQKSILLDTNLMVIKSGSHCQLIDINAPDEEDGYKILYDFRHFRLNKNGDTIYEKIKDIDISPNGLVLATTAEDGITRFWDINTADTLGEFYISKLYDVFSGNNNYGVDIEFSKSGKNMIVLGRYGDFYYLNTEKIITGIKEKTVEIVKNQNLYPNPVYPGGEVSISGIDTPVRDIQVFSITGELIIRKASTSSRISFTLPPGIIPGIYFVRTTLRNGKMITKKLIVGQ